MITAPSRLCLAALALVFSVGPGASFVLPWGSVCGAEAPARRPASQRANKGKGTLILNTAAYWRSYLHGGPARISYEMMEKDGEKLLDGKRLKRYRERLLRKLKKEGRTTDDWRREIYYETYWNLNLLNQPGVQTTPPPADWMEPAFDDRDWSRHQKPFKMAKDFYVDGVVDHFFQVRLACFRTTFEIPDPDQAGKLHLRLVYRGGVRAFLNGKEIGRGHLPEGELAPDAPAEPYPAEAYILLNGEYPPDRKPAGHRRQVMVKPEIPLVTDIGVYAGAPDDFDGLEKSDRVPGPYRRARAIGYGGNCFLNRAGYERIMKLRDRVLEIGIPRSRVNKGTNVLALELRSSELGPAALGWKIPWSGNIAWKHGWLLDVQLRTGGKDVPSVLHRPAGIQVWVEDVHHRMYTPDFYPPGELPRQARIVAARNGTHSAQIVIGTDRELKGLRATVRDFRGAAKAPLPASIARVLYAVGHPAWEMRALGQRKGAGEDARPGFAEGVGKVVLERYSTIEGIMRRGRERDREREMKRIGFFDHLSPRMPEGVPAGTCEPIWISVSVPEDAAPGAYRAAVRVEAEGMGPVRVPLELEVLDWRVPDPKDFQTVAALEQSPYAVARHYGVEPWSDEHFRLLAKGYELLAKVGNDLLVVPVVCKTEFGNSTDSPLRVIRKKDGGLALDFSILDRYVALAAKHWGEPRCVAFIVDHSERQPVGIYVTDEATGRREWTEIGKEAPEERRRRVWRFLATGIHAHMTRRGLEGSLRWGLHGDGVNDPSLVKLLREFAPEVTWVRYSHRHEPDETYSFCATVRSGGNALSATSRRGWKAPPDKINLWMPRNWNGAAVCYGTSEPFAYRLGIERALVAGMPGAARIGADHWDSTWLHDFPRCPYAGMSILSVLWPGPDGAESSARFEMLCEGIQETEARIFLEQALEKLDDPKLGKEITTLLDKRIHDTIFALVYAPHCKIEEYSTGWQVRSRKLYQMAARVAKRIGVDFARSRLAATIPARGKAPLTVSLRNWTARPRAWKLSADQAWIRPERSTGEAAPGSGDLKVTLDAARLEPGKPVQGTLTLIDVQTGRAEPLEIAAQVSEVFRFAGPDVTANVTCGTHKRLSFTLLNTSAAELNWTIAPSQPWLKPEPGSAKLAPGEQCPIAIVVAPPDKTRARHDVTLRISEKGGAEHAEKLTVHVLPRRQVRSSRPSGRAVPMEELPKESLISYIYSGRKRNPRDGLPFHKPGKRYGYWGLCIGRTKDAEGKDQPTKEFKSGFAVPPGTEATCRIELSDLNAFSAEVGWLSDFRLGGEDPMLHFEVYVDGKFAGHSGLMSPADPPRLMVIEGLKGADEIRLVTRLHNDRLNKGEMRVHGVWGNPVFHH